MKNEMLISKNQIIAVSLSVLFYKSGKFIIAECKPLGLITCGKNFEESKKMFNEAFKIWKDDVISSGNLKKALLELGWEVVKNSVTPKETTFKVPLHILAGANINFKIPVSALN